MENSKRNIHNYSKQELYDELHERTSKVIKSVTPKYDITWWVKWVSSIIIICAIIFWGILCAIVKFFETHFLSEFLFNHAGRNAEL